MIKKNTTNKIIFYRQHIKTLHKFLFRVFLSFLFLPHAIIKTIHSVDIRDSDFKAAKRWSDEDVFANRAYFLFDKEPGELAIQNARDTDSGIYRCRVDFKVAQTRNSKVNLTVISKYILRTFNCSFRLRFHLFICSFFRSVNLHDFPFCFITFIQSTVPPDKITIRDNAGAEKTSVVGPYSEGDVVTLSCEVYGGTYLLNSLQPFSSVYKYSKTRIDNG